MKKYIVEVYDSGLTFWRNEQCQLHRDGDLPAVEGPDGYKAWCQNGKLSRETGPARIQPDGRVEYWINGEELTEEQFNARTKQPTNDTSGTIKDIADQLSEIVKQLNNI